MLERELRRVGRQVSPGHFGGDPNIVGKTVRLNTKLFVVIGVTAPDFVGLGLQKMRVKDAWLPLMMRSEVSPQEQNWLDRRDCWLTLAGRVKPGRVSRGGGVGSHLFAGAPRGHGRSDDHVASRVRLAHQSYGIQENVFLGWRRCGY